MVPKLLDDPLIVHGQVHPDEEHKQHPEEPVPLVHRRGVDQRDHPAGQVEQDKHDQHTGIENSFGTYQGRAPLPGALDDGANPRAMEHEMPDHSNEHQDTEPDVEVDIVLRRNQRCQSYPE